MIAFFNILSNLLFLNREAVQHCFVWTTDDLMDSVAFSPQANYTNWANATGRQIWVPAFVDREVSHGQRGRSPTAVILSFLDQSC
jgi:hypothetical protein